MRCCKYSGFVDYDANKLACFNQILSFINFKDENSNDYIEDITPNTYSNS